MYQMDKQNEQQHTKEPIHLEQHWQDEVWTKIVESVSLYHHFKNIFLLTSRGSIAFFGVFGNCLMLRACKCGGG